MSFINFDLFILLLWQSPLQKNRFSHGIFPASFHLQAIKIETDIFNSDLKMTFFYIQ